jgi:hypothetical protein
VRKEVTNEERVTGIRKREGNIKIEKDKSEGEWVKEGMRKAERMIEIIEMIERIEKYAKRRRKGRNEEGREKSKF